MKHLLKFRAPLFAICFLAIFFVLALHERDSAKSVMAHSGAAPTIVIDAGHGGVDGGTQTATGILESKINLEIAFRLRDCLQLLGYETCMVRTEDVSIHSSDAVTIAQKKVSDLKNRVQLIETTNNAVLVSIHQNSYPDAKFKGAQIFAAPTDGSAQFASITQALIAEFVDPSNHRSAKQVDSSVYLMNHISCPGILAECGFLSNDEDAALLQTDAWQIKLTTALSCAVNQYTGEAYGNEI